MTHPINNFRARLAAAPAWCHFDMFYDEMSSNDSRWEQWGRHDYSVTVHGVTGKGKTSAEALANWIKSSDFHPAATENPILAVQ